MALFDATMGVMRLGFATNYRFFSDKFEGVLSIGTIDAIVFEIPQQITQSSLKFVMSTFAVATASTAVVYTVFRNNIEIAQYRTQLETTDQANRIVIDSEIFLPSEVFAGEQYKVVIFIPSGGNVSISTTLSIQGLPI